MKLPDLVLPQKDIDDMGRPLENDLLALLKLLEEATLRLLDRAMDEGWMPEELERELEALVMGENRIETVQKATKPVGTISERNDLYCQDKVRNGFMGN